MCMSTNERRLIKLAKQKENTERINIFLSPETLETLKNKASQKGLSVSGLIRMIILEYLDK